MVWSAIKNEVAFLPKKYMYAKQEFDKVILFFFEIILNKRYLNRSIKEQNHHILELSLVQVMCLMLWNLP